MCYLMTYRLQGFYYYCFYHHLSYFYISTFRSMFIIIIIIISDSLQTEYGVRNLNHRDEEGFDVGDTTPITTQCNSANGSANGTTFPFPCSTEDCTEVQFKALSRAVNQSALFL